jgi:outer membrane protein with glycine zipper
MRHSRGLLILVVLLFATQEVMAAVDVYVYPGKGQTKEQQEQDEFSCYKWAKEQTGFDPNQPMQQQAAASPQQGAAVKGAARGAAIGAIGGAIGGDAGKGAAIGAGVGAAGGTMRRRQAEQQQAAAQEKAKQAHNAQMADYKRAFSGCMTARGYTVS